MPIKKNPKTYDECISEAIENISGDRAHAAAALTQVMAWAGASVERYEKTGFVIAKLLETLQRSNEQLVKIAQLKKEKNSNKDLKISDDEKETIFDEIQESPEDEEDEEDE